MKADRRDKKRLTKKRKWIKNDYVGNYLKPSKALKRALKKIKKKKNGKNN
jgi:hypothetical protein